MAEVEHLDRAPIVEAVLGIMADSSQTWDPEVVRGQLASLFPEHREIQEQRLFESKFHQEGDQLPQTMTRFLGTISFLCKSQKHPSVHHVRRDGYAFSQLEPYPTWEEFVAEGMQGWQFYQAKLQPKAPHSVFVRFINKLRYPKSRFRLEDYFTTAPSPPANTDWSFQHFQNTAVFDVRDPKFIVRVSFSVVPEGCSDHEFEFLLDTTVELKRSLSEIDESIESLLQEMRALKNQAFFSNLTSEAIKPYR